MDRPSTASNIISVIFISAVAIVAVVQISVIAIVNMKTRRYFKK